MNLEKFLTEDFRVIASKTYEFYGLWLSKIMKRTKRGPLGKICPNSFGLSMLTCRVIKSELRHFSRSGKFAVTLQLPLVQGWAVVNVKWIFQGCFIGNSIKYSRAFFQKNTSEWLILRKAIAESALKNPLKKINLSGLFDREFHKTFISIFQQDTFGRLILRK